MNEHIKQDSSSNSPHGELELVVLVKKIQQQLVFLERKLDTLIAQSSQKPFQNRTFPKPFRSFKHSGDRPRESGNYSEKKEFGRPSHFEQPPSDQGHGFSKRKAFFRNRNNRKKHS